jgi:transposase
MFSENVTMEKVTLNRREQNRLRVLSEVNRGAISIKQASMVMELSIRHTKRLLAGFRQRGAEALAHGNRGRRPYNRIDPSICEQVVELAKVKYKGFNQQHFSEKLSEQEGIPLSRSTVRRVLLEQGIVSPRHRRAPKHRSRRERYPQSGMMLQTDGSPHDWLEGRGPKFCLIGAIDDATSEVPYAYFQSQENTAGYIRMLREITRSHGIPLAFYHDQHSIFEISEDKLPTLAEQLAGKKPQTQLGRLLDELGINSISAKSPQAKGRVERLWNTFQDRLVSELRLVKAKSIQEANQVLSQFLPDYNRRFRVSAQEPGSAYRQPGSDFQEDEIFCYKYERTVGTDNVVRYGPQRLQILPTPQRQSYARCKVRLHLRVDNTLAIYYEGQALPTRPAPLEAPALRKLDQASASTNSQKKPAKSEPFNPWRQWVYRK